MREEFFQNLLGAGIIISLIFFGYMKITKKTLRDIWEDFRDGVSNKTEEIIE